MNKQIPTLRFPQFVEEWEEKKLGDISSLITKGTTPKEFTNQGINFIKLECFEENKINTKKCLFIDEKTHTKELKRSILQQNDILFAIAGATIGKINIVTSDILPANTNQALAIVRLEKNRNVQFIYQILKSPTMQKYITESISVGAQPNINLEQMNNFTFFSPSIEEQNTIADFLSAVDKRILSLKQKYELLKLYKKGIMQQIFSQELQFKDDAGQDFSEWEEKTLGEVAEIYQPKTISQSELTKEGFNVFGANGIIGKYKEYNHELPQIAVTCRGNTCGTVNLTTAKAWITGNAMVVNVDKNNNINKLYLYHLLSFTNFTYLITGSGQPQITSNIKQHKIILPCLAEQKKIAEFLTAIDEKIEKIGQQIAQSEEWKRGLLQRMLV